MCTNNCYHMSQVSRFCGGNLFSQVKHNQDGVQNVYGALFFLVTTATFSNITSVQFVSMIVLGQELVNQVSFKFG